MEQAAESKGYVCAYSGCRKQVTGMQLRFFSGRRYRLNGNWLCSESCFRDQFLVLVEYWLKSKFNPMAPEHRRRLGLMLLEARIITPSQLEAVVELKKRGDRRRIGDLVMELGYANEQQITQMLSRQEGLPWLDLDLKQITIHAARRVPPEVAVTSLIVPMDHDDLLNQLYVVAAAPVDRLAIESLERMNRCRVNVFIGPESKVRQAIAHSYSTPQPNREAKCTYLRNRDELQPIVEAAVGLYCPSPESNLEVARCRDLLWIRASDQQGVFDWFLLLEPLMEWAQMEYATAASSAE